MIEITQLTKTYGGKIHALRGISLTIGSGMFGLVGPNGAGKTSLMRILAGLLRPTSGRVHILGHDITTPRGKQAVKAQLGYLPQELGIYPNLTARQFLDYVAVLKGITDGKSRLQQIDDLIARVRLEDAVDQQLKTFSGGMKRRVGIAQALLNDPRLVIVDEPTVGLDPEERVRLRNLLGDVAKHAIVILSTHIIEDISQSCNALAVINQGQVLFQGAPSDLIARARGKVWTLTMADDRPDESLSIVSTLQLGEGVQYRVVGCPDGIYQASSAAPSLEDGYICLMHESRQEKTRMIA